MKGRHLSFVAALVLLTACGGEPTPATGPPPGVPAARTVLPLAGAAGSGQRIIVPEAAITRRGGIPGVYILSDAGRARFRMVKTGKPHNGAVAIISGLMGDETLILGDLDSLYDGRPVRPIKNSN